MRLFLACLALLACLGLGAYGLLRAGADSPAATVEANIGDTRFVFAPAYARDEATAAGGFQDRLAFVAVIPDFSPPPRAARALSPKALTERARDNVFITVSPKDDGVDPADRPMQLYARFLEAETVAGPGGLVMRRFEQGSPYDLEQLYVAPPDGRDFFARCPKPASDDSGVRGVVLLCVSRRRTRRGVAFPAGAARKLGDAERGRESLPRPRSRERRRQAALARSDD